MLITFKLLKAYILVWWPCFSYIDPHIRLCIINPRLTCIYFTITNVITISMIMIILLTLQICPVSQPIIKKKFPSTINLNYDNVLGP